MPTNAFAWSIPICRTLAAVEAQIDLFRSIPAHELAREVGDEVRLLLAERRDVALTLARITPAVPDERRTASSWMRDAFRRAAMQ